MHTARQKPAEHFSVWCVVLSREDELLESLPESVITGVLDVEGDKSVVVPSDVPLGLIFKEQRPPTFHHLGVCQSWPL